MNNAKSSSTLVFKNLRQSLYKSILFSLLRISLVDDVNRNVGLRKARLAWYLALDLFESGDLDSMIEELDTMLDGIEQSYIDVGRDSHTQYFLKTQSNKIAETFTLLGQDELLKDMKEIDPDRREIYQSALDTISE